MQNFLDFCNAALPWVVLALLIAILGKRAAKIEKGNAKASDDDTVAGEMSLGLCLGMALGAAFGNIGIGMMIGMLFGLVFGSVDKSAGAGDKEVTDENE